MNDSPRYLDDLTAALLKLEHELELACVLTEYPIRNAVADLRAALVAQLAPAE